MLAASRMKFSKRYFSLNCLYVWGVEPRIALPEERCLAGIVAWGKRFLVVPDTANTWVVLKVLPNTWKMLHKRDSEAL